jgi:hypothetical protein
MGLVAAYLEGRWVEADAAIAEDRPRYESDMRIKRRMAAIAPVST